jgi:hypothetical protein
MARLLFIVARDQPGLLEFLRRDFALEVVQGDVEIFIDRRTRRPGQVVQAHRAEGRDRRSAECSPVGEDQVVVDLGKRMNKVLEIDEMLGSPLPNGDRDELECR